MGRVLDHDDRAPGQTPAHEFRFRTEDFRFLRQLIRERTGIALGDAKEQLVYSRLARRLRALGLTDFRDYTALLKSGDEEELGRCIDAITTNLTSFFRERHHFEYLARKLLPALVRRNAATKRIRMWSAGCSTGEEPYSIAMVMQRFLETHHGWNVRILATDLDSQVVATAIAGEYAADKTDSVPKSFSGFLERVPGNPDLRRIAAPVRSLITFHQLNLLHEWPMRGPFDAIFCRNVVIYFDKETQRALFRRYHGMLASQALLFLGHSESMNPADGPFELLGRTIHRKAGGAS